MNEDRAKRHGVGILGAAHVHTGWYAAEFRQSSWAQIKAATDWDLDRARAMLGEEQNHIPDYYTNPKEMLRRDDIDIVCIASETCRHAEYAIAAAEAGKHICMEKVIALTLPEADAVIAAAAKAGVKLICPPFAHDTRPAIRKAKELIDNGIIGAPNLAHFHIGHEGLIYSRLEAWFYDPALAGGGALMDLGVHPIYEALYLFGSAAEVSCTMTNFYKERMLGDYRLTDIRIEDNAITTVKFRNGAMCVWDVSLTRLADKSNAAIYGTEGTIILENQAPSLSCWSANLSGSGSGDTKWESPELPVIKAPIEVLADLVEKEEGTWRVNGQWARAVLEVILAAYESARTGKTIILS